MNRRTPKQIERFLRTKGYLLDVPEAYLGNEPNTFEKERNMDGYCTWLQGAGYAYTESMGNSSVPLVWEYVNLHPDWVADRFYATNTKNEDKVFEKAGIPIFGLSSKRPMGAFDIVGISLNFALLLQNVVRSLQLSGIPVWREEREKMDEPYPLFIAGANVIGVPTTSQSLFDMYWIGEIEDEENNPGLHYFLSETKPWIDSGDFYTAKGREAYLRDIVKKCPWLYIPRFYKFKYFTGDDGYWRVEGWDTLVSEAPNVVKKRIVHDLNSAKITTAPPVSYYGTEAMWTGNMEVSRGCSAKSVRSDTLVSLADGTALPIATIVDRKLDVKVLGYDFESNEVVVADILNWFGGEVDDDKWFMLRLNVSPLRSLFVSEGHLIWTVGKGYVAVEDLEIGDGLLYVDNDGTVIGGQLTDKRVLTNKFAHYDIQTSTGNFFANGVLVHNCTFCAANYRQLPFRMRDADVIVDSFKELVKNTGAIDLSPLSLEWGTHSQKKQVTRRMFEEVTTYFGTASLRVDNIADDPEFALVMKQAGKTSATLGVEGMSQRLRTAISKGLSRDDILQAVTNLIAAGMQKLKIYMISSLPGETIEDQEDLLELAKEIDRIRRNMGKPKFQVRFSFTPLIIQAWTPLQWAKVDLEQRNLAGLYHKLRDIGFGFNFGGKAAREYQYFSQLAEIGDPIAGEAILEVMEGFGVPYHGTLPKGGVEKLEAALAKRGRSFADYFREKDPDEVFSWDVVDMIVSKKYLRTLYEEMLNHLATHLPDDTAKRTVGPGYLPHGSKCFDRCDMCAACTPSDLKKLMSFKRLPDDDNVSIVDVKAIDMHTFTHRLRLKMLIDSDYYFARPAHWRGQLRRALNLAGYKYVPKGIVVATQAIKDRSWFQGVEFVEIPIRGNVNPKKFIRDLNEHLVHAEIIDVVVFPKDIAAFKPQQYLSLYRQEIDMSASEFMYKFNSIDTDSMKVRIRADVIGGGFMAEDKLVDWNDAVEDVWATTHGINSYAYYLLRGDVSPYSVYRSIFGGAARSEYKHPAVLLDLLVPRDRDQDTWFTSACPTCGTTYYTNALGRVVSFCIECAVKGRLTDLHFTEELLSNVLSN